MPTFEYTADDANGQSVSGTIIAANLAAAVQTLTNRGLNVGKIDRAQFINDPLSAQGRPASPGPTPTAPLIGDPSAGTPPEPKLVFDPAAQKGSGQAGSGLAGSEQAGSGQTGATTAAPRQEFSSAANPTSGYAHAAGAGPAEVPRAAGSSSSTTHSPAATLAYALQRPPLEKLGFYFRQLATMQKAGVPIVQAAQTLAAQQTEPRMQAMAQDVLHSAAAGVSLSTALARHPETVGSVVLAMIQVGETGGFLDEALERADEYIHRDLELRRLYQKVTLYPKLIFASSFIIIAAANAIIAAAAPGKQGLSTPFSLGTWIILALIAAGVWLYFRVGLKNPAVKLGYDRYILRLPVIGPTMHELAMARFGRAFGALHKAGVPVGDAMHHAASVCGNEELRLRMTPFFDSFREGHTILEVFRSTRSFSPIVLDMVATGETTGNIEQMLEKVADYYEAETSAKQMAIATIVGVVVYLCVAVYVGYIVIGFYGSYFGGMMSAAGS